MSHKAGFVNIIGQPNVGKSTLMNALVGEPLSIITSKAQTTRHRIIGIVNDPEYQIVFSDLPGILEPHYKLQERMMKFIETSLQDADIFLFMIEAGQKEVHMKTVDRILESSVPVIVLLNKIDLSTQAKVLEEMTYWSGVFKGKEIIPVSALNNFNIDSVRNRIVELLPENPPFYPKDELTDKNLRFFVAEIIREKVLLNFKKEVPYSVEIAVEAFRETEGLVHIDATIFVSRESQKMIILGKDGKAIKRLGTDARIDLEKFLDKKVFLNLTVKVSKDWRNNEIQLNRFGYQT
jgi:GTPase